MSNTGWVAVVVVVLIILLGGWWWYAGSNPAPIDTAANGAAAGTQLEGTPTPDNGQVGGDADASGDVGVGDASKRTEVHYTSSGFSPKTVTIAKGTGVTFINDTSGPMWVASDEHPTHTDFDGTSRETHCSGSYTGPTPFDECQTGSSYTFVFSKAGSFVYHNHSAANFEGTVVVQ